MDKFTRTNIPEALTTHYTRQVSVVYWPNRSQKYTVWQGGHVVAFCNTAQELDRFMEYRALKKLETA